MNSGPYFAKPLSGCKRRKCHVFLAFFLLQCQQILGNKALFPTNASRKLT